MLPNCECSYFYWWKGVLLWCWEKIISKGTHVEKLNMMARFYLRLRELTHLWGHRRLLSPFKPSTQFSEFSLAWVRPSYEQTLFLGLLGFFALYPTWLPFQFPQARPCPSLSSPGSHCACPGGGSGIWFPLHRSQQRNVPSSSLWEFGPGWRLQGDSPVHSQE